MTTKTKSPAATCPSRETWTDEALDRLGSIFDRCEADLRALPFIGEIEHTGIDVGTGALQVRIRYAARDTWRLEIRLSTYSWNVWNKQQPFDQALEYARANVALAELAIKWDAEFGDMVFGPECIDPAKAEASRAKWEARQAELRERDEAKGQAKTQRRREVLAKVSRGEELTAADARLTGKMPMLIGGGILTELGRELVPELIEG